MKKINAFLVQGVIVLDIKDVEDVINDFIQDWALLGKGPLTLPTIQKGVFRGYVNYNGWPVGTFYCEDGRVFKAEVEHTYEVKAS